ncbi:hypothetical protein CRG98_006936 [Punica granatum]|uniref:PRP1 splicing factor N-terminal domain-containing protein n=1 Tax=Punica granatum TaxID=22663 RepID=A0A2I0KW38_PUNGR|nr:hypothetical protein CRG98_006936 [Punica granatum]
MEQRDQRMYRMIEQLTQQMAALLENQNRRNPNPNSDPDREEIEYDSNSKGGATLFSKENPSDEAFFVAGGNGEPDFDEDVEGDDKGYDENWKFDEFEGNNIGLFVSAEYDEDDKEADAVWEAIDKRMDSQRNDRREARLKQEIEKYCASNQQMRTMISYISIEPITAAEYFESGFFPIIRSEAWANIGFWSSMEDVYVCVDNFIARLLGRILSTQGRIMRQTSWKIGIWRKLGFDDPVSRKTASGAKLMADGHEISII